MLRTAKQFQNSGSSSGAKNQGCDSGSASAGYVIPWSRTRGTVLLNTQKLRKTQPAFSNQAALQMLSPSILRLQPKLTINQPGDRYEQEADRVAEDVMRTPDPKGAHSMSTAATGDQSQRKCACSGSRHRVRKVQAGRGRAAQHGSDEWCKPAYGSACGCQRRSPRFWRTFLAPETRQVSWNPAS